MKAFDTLFMLDTVLNSHMVPLSDWFRESHMRFISIGHITRIDHCSDIVQSTPIDLIDLEDLDHLLIF